MSISFIKSKCNPHTHIHSLTLNELFRLKKNWKQKKNVLTRQKTNWANVHFVNLTFFSFVAICFSIENVQLFSLSQCFACAIIVDKTAALQKKCYQYIFFFSPNAHSQSGKKALRKKWWKNHCSPTMVQCGSFFRDTYSVRLGRHTSSYKCTNKQQRLFDKKKSSSSNSNS